MKATIAIDRLRLRAFHGVGEQERRNGNIFEVSVSLVYPPALKAVTTDNVDDTLNYANAVDIIKETMSQPSDLLEHVAGRIHSALMTAYPSIESGTISITKLAPPVSAELSGATFTLEF